MTIRRFKPVAAAVIGRREYDRVRIAVGDVTSAVVEFPEVHLDIAFGSVVVVTADPSDRVAVIFPYKRRIGSGPSA